MKKELKEIVENSDVAGLKKYITDDKSLDYLFPTKLGDYSVSLNALVYCLHKNKDDLTKIILKEANPLFLKDAINSGQTESVSRDIVVSKCIEKNEFQNRIYDLMDSNLKKKTAKKVMEMLNNPTYYKDIQPENYYKFLEPADRLNLILKEDDATSLLGFIEKHPKFFNETKENYLLKTINNQAVFCFDVLKDHLKTIKLQNNVQNTSRPKVF